MNSMTLRVAMAACVALVIPSLAQGADHPERVFWGDTHLHTSYSPDAFLMRNNTADPDTAYRFAKGLPVIHPYHRARIQIHTPLDFLVVSDHAEFMGVVPKILQGDPLVADTETGRRYRQLFDEGRGVEAFGELIAQVNGVVPPDPNLYNVEINRDVWNDIMEAADRHNDPGTFTAFMGWEWSSTPGGANLHRVVIMREGKETGERFIPYSSLDSAEPEDLWTWLDETTAATGAHFIAIPHNSNISQGLMFPLQDSAGNVISADYAETRMRWEPIVETTQIKGDSETHPRLSPNDEFADFETYDHLIAVEGAEAQSAFGDGFLGQLSEADRALIEANLERAAEVGDYVRPALMRGLAVEARIGVNPYKFGLIGSTDSHTAMSSAEEYNFHGKMAIDSTPESKKEFVVPGVKGWDMGAAGLVGVWARDMAERGYDKGVPMGGELVGAEGDAPGFMVSALKDPVEANLDRIQIVKGWLDAQGVPHEKVFDVALSDGRSVAADGSVPPVGNSVDLGTGKYMNDIGNPELSTLWTDPEFDATMPAFYYVRVLQIPTPRHTLYDAIALGIDVKDTGHPATIQERVYSSPIWYTP
jgi:hypothetical protein